MDGEGVGGGGRGERKELSSFDLRSFVPSALGGFEAGKQALLDLDDWAGLNDSYVSSNFLSQRRIRRD